MRFSTQHQLKTGMKHPLNVTNLGLVALLILPASPAFAQDQPQARRAAALSQLAQCRSITDDSARLQCFDRTVEEFDSAERSGDVVVLDREQVRETNRQLFGFQVVNPFAGRTGAEPEPEMEAIETTLRSASPTGDGKWVFRLADGSEWRQIDSGSVNFRNREGQGVRVRRASLGSYMMTIEGSRAVRVRRQ